MLPSSDIYKENLALYPLQAVGIYKLQPAESYFTLIVNDKYLHSRYAPLQEAERKARELIGKENDLIILAGCGLGYLAEILLKKGFRNLLWFESDDEILFHAFHLFNFSHFIKDGRLRLINQYKDDFVENELKKFAPDHIHIIPFRPSNVISSSYQSFTDFVFQTLQRKNVNQATLIKFQKSWANNIITSYPLLQSVRPVSHLFSKFQNAPCVICGAGPSLAESMSELRQVKDKVFIICVDTALHVLLSHSIEPDIVVSVDPQPLNRSFLEVKTRSVIYVVDPATSYLSLRLLPPENIYVFDSPFPSAKFLFSFYEHNPGKIAYGGSVSTNAYDLACQMGFQPIYFAGQDLSFARGEVHARGAMLEERLNLKECKTFRREMHNYKQLHALPVKYLFGLSGKQVPTNDKMLIFHQWFCDRFKIDSAKGLDIRNATAYGAHLPYLKTGRLLDFIDLPELNKAIQRESYNFDKKNFIAGLNQLIIDFHSTYSIASQALQLVKKNIGKKDLSPEFLQQLDLFDEEIRSKNLVLDFCCMAMQKVIFDLMEDSNNMHPLTQSENFYEELRASLLWHIKKLEKAMQVLCKENSPLS